MKNQKILLFTLLASLSLLTACDKEEDPTGNGGDSFRNGFFVLCEGNFGSATSSLDFLHRDEGLRQNVYAAANAGLSPGDVLQSMTRDADRFFLVVNNSGKIDVVASDDLRLLGSITGMTSPRYMAKVNNSKAYVSDLFEGDIYVVNTDDLSISGRIPAGGWVERMVVASSGQVYAASMTRDQILVLDPVLDAAVDSFATGREPEGMLLGTDGRLYVLCTGGFGEAEPELIAFDPDSGAELDRWSLGGVGQYRNELCRSQDGAWLYWLGSEGVFRMATNASSAPADPWIATPAGSFFYSLDADLSGSAELVVGDARDFVSRGMVWRYAIDGTLLDTFSTGINPGSFYFVP
jgi:hypothetical protein